MVNTGHVLPLPTMRGYERKKIGHLLKKSRIRETPTLLTDADSRTHTILERLRDLFFFIFLFLLICYVI